jgi:hypothetical protein
MMPQMKLQTIGFFGESDAFFKGNDNTSFINSIIEYENKKRASACVPSSNPWESHLNALSLSATDPYVGSR